MLSAHARPLIDASVPVLRQHGLQISQTFYRNLFGEYPELIPLFNQGNQANGSQPLALASAVFAYAAHHAEPEVLAPVLSRIVHKHVSVGVRAEHYPLVGRHLLGAIQETLGPAATPALLEAWDEAYGLLATALMRAEEALYHNRDSAPGQVREMRVTALSRETAEVIAYTLTPCDGKAPWDFQPGQYVSVQVELPGGMQQWRQYSLSNAPGQATLRISVRRRPASGQYPAGVVSNWLHAHLTCGSVLKLTAPAGDFTPDLQTEAPLVLLSAGMGLAPMLSVLQHLARVRPEHRVIVGHADRDPASHAHRQELAAIQAVMPQLQLVLFYEHSAAEVPGSLPGRLDLAHLPAWPHAESPVYLCGSRAFLRAQWAQLLAAGVPVARLHREVFGPEWSEQLV
ncbi:MAG: globin domain-containing protein [Candidatus Sericytochromatia bacterium]